jgi:chromate transporter
MIWKGRSAMAQNTSTSAPSLSLGQLVLYFLKLGTIGFGGPAALVGYMRKDLVDGQRIDEQTYNLSIALAQIMPGPLAAQTAIAIGYFQGGALGATLVGFAFIVPSFVMVLALSWLYVTFGGLPWMQALFYGIGAVVIAIIAMAAYRLARGTNKQDPVLWGIFGVMLVATAWSQAELAALFILAGLVVMYLRAWPGWRAGLLLSAAGALAILAIWGMETFLLRADSMANQDSVLVQILLFFTKAGAFVFGSGLAIVPFLEQGVVHDLSWLTDHQFLDAVAVAMITPGPVVITVAFIGYLVAGTAGAIVAAIGIFLPVYLFTTIPAPWFRRHRDNPQLQAFAAGATAAASGAIAGAVVVLGQRAIYDLPTAAIGLIGLVLLWRFRLQEPLLVVAAGIAGLVVWPIFQGG